MQQNTQNQAGTSRVPSGNALLTLASTTTATGFRSHALTTRDRDFAFSLFEQALEFDNEPSFGAARGGVFFIEFIASDDECATVLAVARGGHA